MNDGIPQEVLRDLIPIIAVSGGIVIAIVAIVLTNIRAVLVSRAREASRREIAAFVAEGTMSPQDGERLLSAGKSVKGSCC